jgi:hypothetical protein
VRTSTHTTLCSNLKVYERAPKSAATQRLDNSDEMVDQEMPDADQAAGTMQPNVSAPPPIQTPMQPMRPYVPGSDPYFLRPISPRVAPGTSLYMNPPSLMMSAPMQQPDFSDPLAAPHMTPQQHAEMLSMLQSVLAGMLPTVGAPMAMPTAPAPSAAGPSGSGPSGAPPMAPAPAAAAAAPVAAVAAARWRRRLPRAQLLPRQPSPSPTPRHKL